MLPRASPAEPALLLHSAALLNTCCLGPLRSHFRLLLGPVVWQAMRLAQEVQGQEGTGEMVQPSLMAAYQELRGVRTLA